MQKRRKKEKFPFCECHIYRYGYNQFIPLPPALTQKHFSLGMVKSDEKHATEVKLRNLRNVLEIHLRIFSLE